jgi:biotin carboxyl carrier protein
MKLMTPVHAGVGGTVVAILAENAAPVDAQAVLMRVKPAAP